MICLPALSSCGEAVAGTGQEHASSISRPSSNSTATFVLREENGTPRPTLNQTNSPTIPALCIHSGNSIPSLPTSPFSFVFASPDCC
ncbi:hypothetical protein B0T16DRAFT_34530 [Cercophora newfieldiana]|uniref:Uncharacterized protein n=1 Tax=Cercophora newfieldiana TaxID=92897 RepID=A0AA39YPI5_9PEZI|nr:hypothetical protein B0T16DRAFT_34530 [Cercophora newfieldiana]